MEKEARVRSLDVTLQGREKVTIDPPAPAYMHTAHKANYSSTNEMLNVGLRLLEDTTPTARDQAIPFTFDLPRSALSSYLGKYANVSWKIRARADLPWRFDLADEVYLRILSTTTARRAPPTIETKGVTPKIRIELSSNIYAPGDTVEGSVTVLDPSTFREIRIQIIQVEDAMAKGTLRDLRRLENRPIGPTGIIGRDRIAVGVPSPFRLQIPSLAPTSYRGTYSSVSWLVEVLIDLPLAQDIHLNLPITVAHVRAEAEILQHTKSRGAEAKATTSTEHPPQTRKTITASLRVSAPPLTGKSTPEDTESPEDIHDIILNALKDGSWKDVLTLSSEIQFSSSGFIDLNRVKIACDELVSSGRLQKRGEGEFFSQYSLVVPVSR